MKKWVGFLAALWLAAGALAPNAAIAADSVKIGVLMPLTGNAAAAGQASKAAIEVAADIVNAAHPELGNIPLAATAGLPHLNGAKLELVFVEPDRRQIRPQFAPKRDMRVGHFVTDQRNALLQNR